MAYVLLVTCQHEFFCCLREQVFLLAHGNRRPYCSVAQFHTHYTLGDTFETLYQTAIYIYIYTYIFIHAVVHYDLLPPWGKNHFNKTREPIKTLFTYQQFISMYVVITFSI